MKIAIHHREGSFSDHWITYCEENKIDYKIVNCYDSDIISQLNDRDGLMWHWTLSDYKAALFARHLTQSLEKKGIKIFPNVNTSWHYDDKVGQKYLLESIGAPLVKSYVFYSKKDALNWIEDSSFPKVFKLRSGAGSTNVCLVKTKHKARHLVNKAFGKGFSHIDRFSRLKDGIWVLRRDRSIAALRNILIGAVRFVIPTEVEKFSHNEKGYIYFQDYIPDNKFDFRIKVVGNYCWGFRRAVRKNDFRASGSGILDFDVTKIPIEMIRIAFSVASILKFQSIAFDFVIDQNQNNRPLIIEMSYCFGFDPRELTNGFWDTDFVYHKENFNPFSRIIANFLN